MKVGVGLPNAVLGATGEEMREWAQLADQAGFSTLAALDRLVYPNFEPLHSLSFVAAVTRRIELMTAIIIAPLRTNTALLAKEAATVDVLSGGRLTLGLAPGGRADDYAAAGVDVRQRGKLFDAQLVELRRHFDDESAGLSGVVPQPRRGRPPILIGGHAPAAFRRAAQHDGWITWGGTQETFGAAVARLREQWQAAGREGEPRRINGAYFALGPDGADIAAEYFGSRFDAEETARRVETTAKTPEAVRDVIAMWEETECDELLLLPLTADPRQLELLVDALPGTRG